MARAKKDFNSLNNNPVFDSIAEVTATKPARKKPEQYTEAEANEMRNAETTQGRSGCKAYRINMAFSPDVRDFIQTMSRVRGQTITDFANDVFKQAMKDNAAIYEQAKAFRDSF